MYRDEKNNNNNHPRTPSKAPEPEFVVQWGKRIRCVRDRVKNPNFSAKSGSAGGGGIRQKVTSRIISDTNTSAAAAAATSADPSFSPFSRFNRVSDEVGRGKSASPEKEERYYTTRGAAVAVAGDESGRSNTEVNGGGIGVGGGGGGEGEKGKFIWPKLYITLSSKEKEADFLAMKGCKLPQRPKKRAKLVQRSLLFVSPGAWLSDMCQERYEVREKKTPKKRPRGLKAMGGILDSDSE